MTHRPHPLAWVSAEFWILAWTMLFGILWGLSFELWRRVEKSWGYSADVPAIELLQVAGILIIAAAGLLFMLRAPLACFNERTEVGPVEIVRHTGALWRRTRSIPLDRMADVEVLTGPLDRLLGIGDLRVAGVTIHGAADPAAVRRRLLGLRDAHRDAAREEGPGSLA